MHGHTFLHSWSGPMTLVVCLLYGATFLSNLTVVLFVTLYDLSSWKGHLLNPTCNNMYILYIYKCEVHTIEPLLF